MAGEKKIAEANECIRQAEKYLKTGFMKWRPDFDSAASEYSKAATCYRGAKSLEQCRESLLKAADCYGRNQSYFSAAKSLEQAAFASKDLEDYTAVIELVNRACQLFRENGTPDTAAMCLEKGAKIIEAKFPDQAVELYMKASEIVANEERSKQAAEYASRASRLLVKLKRYEEAIGMLRKELNNHIEGEDGPSAGRVVIVLVLLYLSLEDYVAADKVFREFGSFVPKDESISLTELLEGYDQGDPEQVYKALLNPFFKHMDVQYAKLARELQYVFAAQKDEAAKKQSGKETGATAVQEDDDFSGSLL